ncbi:MAG: hypothetical protein Q7S35_01420 [Candidatus Limnocylindrales bacterium]|nr:hypothetical protein [Candidatus Limnocylindrales bacterium]
MLTTTATGTCGLQYINQAEGSWIRGGGYTDASGTVYYIAASRPGKQGQFLKDGNALETWWQDLNNKSHAEDWTSYNWKWFWEHFNYTVKGWHGAQLSNGTWILGPDQACTVNQYL